ncbi:hypothetical protein PT974_07710 [Cladobotryum mycophilum]|uniref:C3H1-type domain-containing protein n=1 Tax=Cladobotryum mycophilum TaxID=491253 RepID=A0ABR0SHN5_9HYPO
MPVFPEGECTYGSACNFSHDLTKANATRSRQENAHTPLDANAQQQYYEWKRILRRNLYGGINDLKNPQEALQLWEGALVILDSNNRESHQFLAKDLVDENLCGLEFVKSTVHVVNPDIPIPLSFAKTFLRVITHPSLLECLSIDPFIGTLYTFFSGINGDGAITFLGNMCQNLLRYHQNLSGTPLPDALDVVMLILKALRELLSRDRRARFHDALATLFDSLDKLCTHLADVHSPADTSSLRIRLDVLRRLVESSTNRLVAPELARHTLGGIRLVQSSFPMERELPGGRHDNDLADIWQINIFPTYGEIMSDHPEYLPSTNFQKPHALEDPVQRFLDCSFRILRHDIFGDAKNVLRDLLKQSESTNAPFLSSQDTSAHIYLRSNIQHIFINQNNELQAVVSFATPPMLRTKSLAEQRRWWQESSRLEEGSLVCFLSSQSSENRLLFLEVAVKSVAAPAIDQTSNKKSGLVSEKFPPSITVKLAACVRNDLNLLARFYGEKAQGVLVDFHGLISATFVPILKNLQQMQRDGDLAFRQWILPSNHGNENIQEVNMPPPAYARRPGFSFSLDSISNDRSHSLKLNPLVAPGDIDIPEMEMRTGLDRGQCLGLVAALTREYALI